MNFIQACVESEKSGQPFGCYGNVYKYDGQHLFSLDEYSLDPKWELTSKISWNINSGECVMLTNDQKTLCDYIRR